MVTITRRQLIIGGVATGAVAAAGIGLEHPITRLIRGRDGHPKPVGQRVLVLVTLYGGNDGLNTVVPADDGAYQSARADLAFKPSDLLPMADGLYLNGKLPFLKSMWDKKQVAIVRGVGYPQSNRSHFRSMDIWQSGVPEHSVQTGWLGRWLDNTDSGGKTLRAVSIGTTVPHALTSEKSSPAAIPLPISTFAIPTTDAIDKIYADLNAGNRQDPLAAAVARSGTDFLTVNSV